MESGAQDAIEWARSQVILERLTAKDAICVIRDRHRGEDFRYTGRLNASGLSYSFRAHGEVLFDGSAAWTILRDAPPGIGMRTPSVLRIISADDPDDSLLHAWLSALTENPFECLNQERGEHFANLACHEASHAVALMELGLPFGCISLSSVGSGNQGHVGGLRIFPDDIISGTEIRNAGIAAVSGVVGEQLHKNYASPDLAQAVDELFSNNKGDASLFDRYGAEKRAKARQCGEAATDLLTSDISKVVTLAYSLLIHGTLSASDAYRFVAKSPASNELTGRSCHFCLIQHAK